MHYVNFGGDSGHVANSCRGLTSLSCENTAAEQALEIDVLLEDSSGRRRIHGSWSSVTRGDACVHRVSQGLVLLVLCLMKNLSTGLREKNKVS